MTKTCNNREPPVDEELRSALTYLDEASRRAADFLVVYNREYDSSSGQENFKKV